MRLGLSDEQVGKLRFFVGDAEEKIGSIFDSGFNLEDEFDDKTVTLF